MQRHIVLFLIKKTSLEELAFVLLEVHMSEKLTQDEADELLNMLKKTMLDSINFPQMGKSIEFDVIGASKKDMFTIKIYRGTIDREKYDTGARIKKNDIPLLELHINKNKIHLNPDGSKIVGPHWHIYTEEYGRRMAFPAENIESDKFIENTMMFLDRFNVIEKPSINYQLEL